MCAAVFSMYEMKLSSFSNTEYTEHIRSIVKANLMKFILSRNISVKMKLYAVAIGSDII